MQLEVIGSGEAYDRYRINASVLVVENDFRLLIDCGPTVPQALWRRELDVESIDVIFFTHIHPDHASGLTALLNHWGSKQRKRAIKILCHPQQQKHLQWLADYAAWPDSLPFAIEWIDATKRTVIGPWLLCTATTRHSIPNLSLRLVSNNQTDNACGSLFYSGDGRPTPASCRLMEGVSLAMQECFSAESLSDQSYHGDLPCCLQAADHKGIRQLLLYHIEYGSHQNITKQIQDKQDVALAEDGQRWCCITGTKLTEAGVSDVIN